MEDLFIAAEDRRRKRWEHKIFKVAK